MRYIIANTDRVKACGISCYGHRTKDDRVVLNEKELGVVPGDTEEARLAAIDGIVYTRAELRQILKEEGWR